MKKFIVLIMIIAALFAFSGCGNKDLWDTVYTYDYAIVYFPDGTAGRIEIKSWTDYEDGDQIQIIAKDGSVYLVHSSNCVLVKEG